MNNNLVRGLAAGFAATLVLSLFTLGRNAIPQLDMVTLLNGVAQDLMQSSGASVVPWAGWIALFLLGTLWCGAIFSLLEPILPGRHCAIKGGSFGVGCSLLVMLMVMPMAGAGYFGMRVSLGAILATLLLYVLYGVTLGVTYGTLSAHYPQPLMSGRRV